MYHRLIDQIGANDGFAPEVMRHAQALIQPESNLDPDAVSRTGAVGLMQLMPATQQRYGVTDPLHPLQNIRGGMRSLQDLYEQFPGRPDLVTAAYNAGPQAVIEAGHAVPNFPETQALVKKVEANLQATPDSSKPRAPATLGALKAPAHGALGTREAPAPRAGLPSPAPVVGPGASPTPATSTPAQEQASRELAQVTAIARQLQALRTAAEQDVRRRGITNQDTVQTILGRYDIPIDALTQRRTQLARRLAPTMTPRRGSRLRLRTGPRTRFRPAKRV